MNPTLAAQLNRFQLASLVIGLIALGLSLPCLLSNSPQFFISYLFGYLFWLGLALGCLVVAMIHSLAGGRWGNVTRRFLEAGFMTLPLMAVMFIPVFFGLKQLYPWANSATVAADKTLQNKAAYLNPHGFVVRMLVFFRHLADARLSAAQMVVGTRRHHGRRAHAPDAHAEWPGRGHLCLDRHFRLH